MPIAVIFTIFTGSLLIALAGLYHRYVEEQFRGSMATLNDRLRMLAQRNPLTIHPRSAEFRFLSDILGGSSSPEDQDRVFTAIIITEILTRMPEEVGDGIIAIIRDYERAVIHRYGLLSPHSLLKLFWVRLRNGSGDWLAQLAALPRHSGTVLDIEPGTLS